MIPLCQKCNGEGKIETTTPENVKYKTYDPCQHCNGSGHDTEWVVCRKCYGIGVMSVSMENHRGESVLGAKSTCLTCNGHGQVRKVTHD